MFLLIDKPKGMTSHDVVDYVRKVTHERRVGHAGTLDPNATGLLIVGVGREATKKLGEIAKGIRKTYIADIIFGEERDTDDSEGIILEKAHDVLPPSLREVRRLLQTFLGEQKQVPPQYSAIKLHGKKAYELARSGLRLELKPRTIEIFIVRLLSYSYPQLRIMCEVSAGTYIRALARDLGRQLGMGGYLGELRRSQIGKYSVEDAVLLNQLSEKNWSQHLQDI